MLRTFEADSLQTSPPLAVATPTDLRAWRLGRLRQCRRRAQALARPVLVRFHLRLASPAGGAEVDPWLHGGACPPEILWHHGRAGETLAAWGALRRLSLSAARPHTVAQAAVATLLEEVVDLGWTPATVVESDMPLCHVAMAFDPETAAAGPAGGTGGELLVPRRQVMRRPGRAGLAATVAGWLAPQDDPAACLAGLEAQWRALGTGDGPAEAPAPALEASPQEAAESWRGRAGRAAAAVAAGELDKVVLARAALFQAPTGRSFCPLATVWALRRRQPGSITYLWRRAGGAAFVGASPELLVAVAGRQLTTHALAGTAPRGRDADDDRAVATALLASAKDRREHQVVVDMLRAALRPHCQRLDGPRQPQVLPLAGLQHLQTPLSGRLRQAGGVLELVAALHPTPAVCGWPKAAARAYLRAHEPLARGWYAGPLGWVTAGGDGAFAVALRSAWLEGERALAYAGAGIVAASDPVLEWRETELKLATVADALRLEPAAAAGA